MGVFDYSSGLIDVSRREHIVKYNDENILTRTVIGGTNNFKMDDVVFGRGMVYQ